MQRKDPLTPAANPADLTAPGQFDLKACLEDRRKRINARLDALLIEHCKPGRLRNAMGHSLMAGGKRLRPVLCLAAFEAVGGRAASEALDVGCALEMIHTYSLIHDDLPLMDDDELRRGQPTCHVAFDEPTALLAGDALLTLAFEILADASVQPRRPQGALRRLEVIRCIAEAAGPNGMIAGQMKDMQSEGQQINRESLEKMHARKTGAMIIAAVVSGAITGGADADQLKHLRDYAGHIGLAFQVTDDILNVEGDPQLMGKARGTDQKRRKSTYPALIGMDESKAHAGALIQGALNALAIFDNKADLLRGIAAYIVRRRR